MRVVLDVAKVKDYSVFELAGPDRLVVDVYGPGTHDTAHRKFQRQFQRQISRIPAPARTANAAAKTSVKSCTRASRDQRGASRDNANSPRRQFRTVGLLPTTGEAHGFLDADAGFGAAELRTRSDKSARRRSTDSESVKVLAEKIGPPPAAKPTRAGERSLTRALGLKIGRIVIDAGPWRPRYRHDRPDGLDGKRSLPGCGPATGQADRAEAALRRDHLHAAERRCTLPLEQRTAIANEAKADLFVSIHANSSDDPTSAASKPTT